MEFILEHLSETMTVLTTVFGLIYSLLKSQSALRDKMINDKFKDLNKRIDEINISIAYIKDELIGAEEIRSIGRALTALTLAFTEFKADTLRKSDGKVIMDDIEELTQALANTREELRKTGVNDKNTMYVYIQERLDRMDDALKLMMPITNCKVLNHASN